MNKIVKIALGATIILGMSATTLSADPAKGQKLYLKNLKAPCSDAGVGTGALMAAKHTQDEWKEIKAAGKLAEEIKTICPKAKDAAVKADYLDDYFDFFHEYGSDSGNVPSC